MDDDFFDFDEHPENFYIVDEMINEDRGNNTSKRGSCCSVLLIITILTVLITIV